MHKKLFIPGPTEVAPEVLAKMATPMIGHRSKDASNLQREITEKLRKVMYTQNPILLSTTSGSGLMEGSIRSLTVKRAIVFSVGAFGDRWFKMAEAIKIDTGYNPRVLQDYIHTQLKRFNVLVCHR